MKSRRNRINTAIGSVLFKALRFPVVIMPEGLAEKFGAGLGNALWPVFRKQRERAIYNMGIAFPELSADEQRALAKKVFRHFGMMAIDFLRAGKRNPEKMLATTEIEGWENVEAAAALGKGILVVTGHLGNWERFGHWGTAKGWPLAVVAREANDAGLNALATQMREQAGLEIISRGDAVRPILKKLKEKGTVAILPDQNSEECYVPFFGKPAGTVMGPAVLHIRTGAPLLPAYYVKVGVGKYRAVILPMMTPGASKTAEEITADLNLALESVVRRYPDQYLWLHDRWRSARAKGLL
ncbi:MAG: lysophospholipid acyltransferase family protein [Armatimonadetes bacterium]|nr:lysophospholipid acyltransferase family protein [Armatimonadota bacterium]